MVQLRVIYDLYHRTHCACFWIIRAVNEALDASVHHSAGAHRARFNCNKQLAVSQTVVTHGRPRLSEGDDFGMSGGVEVGDVAIPSTAYDSSLEDDDSSHGNLIHFEGAPRAAESFFHPEFVGTSSVVGPGAAALRAG
jgi:hypothetical protein